MVEAAAQSEPPSLPRARPMVRRLGLGLPCVELAKWPVRGLGGLRRRARDRSRSPEGRAQGPLDGAAVSQRGGPNYLA